MKRACLLSVMALLAITPALQAADSTGEILQEEESYVSESSIPFVSGVKSWRPVAGGTVFKIYYDGEWSPEMKGALEYAAGISSEVIPPCLPITVKARLVKGGKNGFLTKVGQSSRDNMDDVYGMYRPPVSQIKAVILGEYSINALRSFADLITDESFFDSPSQPDIILTVNADRLDEFCFATAVLPHGKYDFVTIATRELLRGMGLLCPIKAADGKIIVPEGHKTPFESSVMGAIGAYDASQAFVKATSGSVPFFTTDEGKVVSLYAPSQWTNNVSLNYFNETEGLNLTRIINAQIGKGTVIRDISDITFDKLFMDELGWRVFGISSTSSPEISNTGSTENVIPFDGEIFVAAEDEASETVNVAAVPANSPSVGTPEEPLWYTLGIVPDYCEKFHPYFNGESIESSQGWIVSALLKDGTWDCLYKAYASNYENSFSVPVSSLQFHKDNASYARNAEGNLRIRITRGVITQDVAVTPSMCYRSYFYVMEYLPQPPEIGVAAVQSDAAKADDNTVTLGIANTEGTVSMVIERKRKGSLVPAVVEIDDFKNGTFDISVSQGVTTELTPVATNAHGTVRGATITIN